MKKRLRTILAHTIISLLVIYPALCCAEQAAAPADAKSSAGKAEEAFTIQEGRPITARPGVYQKSIRRMAEEWSA